MKKEYKSFQGIELKADSSGSFVAKIATLNVVDKDGDVTLPGAFPNGKEILISSYMHGSWMGDLPVGKGTIREDGEDVLVDGLFNLNSETGKEHYETLKFTPDLSEWSYGFQVLALDEESEWNDNPKVWRVFKSIDVFEASPVLRGAGVDTGLLSIKSDKGQTFPEQAAAALAAVDELTTRAKSLADLRRADGRDLSEKNRETLGDLLEKLADTSVRLKEILEDPEADPEALSESIEDVAKEYLRFTEINTRIGV